MRRLELTGLVAIAMTFTAPQRALEGQAGPAFAASPEIVPYKMGRHGLPPIELCPDFQSDPEKGVVYQGGKGIVPPKVERAVSVSLTKKGKQAYRNSLFKDPNEVISRISILVDAAGKPHAPCLARAAGFDLDQQAAEAAMQYRFKHATKNGKSVSMRMQIEVRYQTY